LRMLKGWMRGLRGPFLEVLRGIEVDADAEVVIDEIDVIE
jgi:hypothetical protein